MVLVVASDVALFAALPHPLTAIAAATEVADASRVTGLGAVAGRLTIQS